MAKRREYGEGSVFQRCRPGICPDRVEGRAGPSGKPTLVRPAHRCTGTWVATTDITGGGPNGKRRRVSVTGKTKQVALAKLHDKRAEISEEGAPTRDARTTVAQWAPAWLKMKQRDLSPRGYNAAASPIRKWIVPTIGHRRLSTLTPADLRAVEDAQRAAGRKGTTAAATHRVLLNMLRTAVVEGHRVPQRVLALKAPKTAHSDRMDVPLDQAVACLAVAGTLDHGTRWALALMFGLRQGEALGLTWDCVDFERDEIRVEWQLDNLPYVDRKRRDLGFRVPLEYRSRHLTRAWHLVQVKSKAGVRVLPMSPTWRQAMLDWRDVAPENPWGLVYPTEDGQPMNDRVDRREWWAIQEQASTQALPVQHPAGRPWHVHECRNAAATQLAEVGADGTVRQQIMGHATEAQSNAYRRIHREPKLRALEMVTEAMQWAPSASA